MWLSAEGCLWALTTYFNPGGFRSRETNFRRFRKNLTVPLLLVELSFDGEFSMGPNDAEIYLPIAGGDRMWQKERLVNLGLACLPDECHAVALLDGDIAFERVDWAKTALQQLDSAPVVQLFDEVRHLPPDRWTPETQPILREPGVAAWTVGGGSLADRLRPEVVRGGGQSLATGFAWAVRRELLVHGMFDRCIVGGGDTAFVGAAFGCTDSVIAKHRMNPMQAACYRTWAFPFHRDVGGVVGYLPGAIYHFWHGSIADRKPESRHRLLEHHEFNPWLDIALHGSGAWRWNSDKPALHREVHRYFEARKEDEAPVSAG